MKRRLFYGALFIVLACNIIIGAQIYFSSVHAAEKDDSYPNLKLFAIVLDQGGPRNGLLIAIVFALLSFFVMIYLARKYPR